MPDLPSEILDNKETVAAWTGLPKAAASAGAPGTGRDNYTVHRTPWCTIILWYTIKSWYTIAPRSGLWCTNFFFVLHGVWCTNFFVLSGKNPVLPQTWYTRCTRLLCYTMVYGVPTFFSVCSMVYGVPTFFASKRSLI